MKNIGVHSRGFVVKKLFEKARASLGDQTQKIAA